MIKLNVSSFNNLDMIEMELNTNILCNTSSPWKANNIENIEIMSRTSPFPKSSTIKEYLIKE